MFAGDAGGYLDGSALRRRLQTTMRYLHYAPRSEDAALVAEAFALPEAYHAEVQGDQ